MDTYTLQACLKKINKIYRKKKNTSSLTYKVLPSNLLPRKITNLGSTIIIVNTDPSKKPGLHWQAAWFSMSSRKKRKCVFFDSYGFAPDIESIKQFIARNSKKIEFNTQQIQSFDSQTCGEYCIIFALYMAQGKSLKKFVKIFSPTDFTSNDKKIGKIFDKLFKECSMRKKAQKRKNIRVKNQCCRSRIECNRVNSNLEK